MIEVLPHLLVGGGSVMGSLLVADRGLPWFRASAASVSQGRGVKELLHLHQTAPSAAKRLRTSVRNPVDPTWYGIRPYQALLGAVDGKPVQAARDRSVVVFGPPGSGKSSLMICNVLSWILNGGVVVCGSEAPDVLRACAGVTSRHGRAYVYDPYGALKHQPQRGVTTLHWSPVRGGENPNVAMEHAKALMTKGGEGTAHEAYFRDAGSLILGCLIHAAALAKLPWSQVFLWATTFAATREAQKSGSVGMGAAKAVDILKHHPQADPALLGILQGYVSVDDRTLSPLVSTFTACLSWCARTDFVAAADAAANDHTDYREILRQPGTSVFMICPTGKGSDDVGPLVTGFLSEINSALRELADKSPSGRVPFPVLRALDEAPNYPIPDLPVCLATDRKRGISTIVIGQDKEQLKRAWDLQFAEEILTTANVKVLLPGIGSNELLTWASKITGYHTINRTSKQTTWHRDRDKRIDEDANGATERPGRIFGHRWLKEGRTETDSPTRELRMDEADISNLEPGTAWVKIGEKPAGIIDLPRHFADKPFHKWTAMEVAEDVEFDDAVPDVVAEPEPEEEEEEFERPAAAVVGGGWVRVIPGGRG